MTTSSDTFSSDTLKKLDIPVKFWTFYTGNIPYQNISRELEQDFAKFILEKTPVYNEYSGYNLPWYECTINTPYDCPYIVSFRYEISEQADIAYFEQLEFQDECEEEYKNNKKDLSDDEEDLSADEAYQKKCYL
jgi:hypothetical protein